MALLGEKELNQIWSDTWDDTLNRSKGSFKRALWYGGRGFVTSKTVGDKGLRKQIRNRRRAERKAKQAVERRLKKARRRSGALAFGQPEPASRPAATTAARKRSLWRVDAQAER